MTTADSAGNYVFRGVPFINGEYVISTTSTDPMGNVAVDDSRIYVDNTIALEIADPTNNSILSEGIVNISGRTDPFAIVDTTDPATGAPLSATAGADGSFIFNGVTLHPGVNAMIFTATDPAGNTVSSAHTLIFDQQVNLTITSIEDGRTYSDSILDVVGETEPGFTVTMTDPASGEVLTTVADENGIYSFNDVVFSEGINTVIVNVTDNFGVTVSANSTFTIHQHGADAAIQSSEKIVFGDTILISVTDRESYNDPLVRDTLTVTVTSPATGDSEELVLIETSGDSGVYVGYLRTIESAESDGEGSGVLSVVYGETVTETYVDPLTADGLVNVPVRATTLITNDEIRVKVNVVSFTGSISKEALADSEISILELDGNEKLTGFVFNYETDSDGGIPKEFIGKMREDYFYTVLVKGDYGGCPYLQSRMFGTEMFQSITPDNRGVRSMALVLDPAGYLYDALTGERVNGADVTFHHEDGSAVIGPFSFFTRMPSSMQTNPQASGDSGADGGFEFIGSGGGSDIVPGNYFIKVSFPANSLLAETYLPINKKEGAWLGIQEPYTGQVFRVDEDNQPIGMRIPLTPRHLATPLLVKKGANKQIASSGDIVTFTVSVSNLGSTRTDPDYPVVVVDRIPVGMTFIRGSAFRSNGTGLSVLQEGNKITFILGTLSAAGNSRGNDKIEFYYQATIDTSITPGVYLTNTAVAEINSAQLSSPSSVTVFVAPDPIFDTATLIGKVFSDANGNGRQDNGETGLRGVRIVIDDGTLVTTDYYGRYSVPGIRADGDVSNYHVVKIDKRSLPEHTRITTPEAVFVNLSPGAPAKADFGCYVSGSPSSDVSPSEDRLFVLMLDGALVDVKSSAGEQFRPNLESMPEGLSAFGRIAFIFDGIATKGLHLTTAFDSNKTYSYDINPDIERDRYYPSYGDDSSVTHLSNSQGRFYLNADTKSSNLLLGNYEVVYEDAGIVGMRRTLHGTKYELEKSWMNKGLEHSDRLTLFTSQRKQLQARTELRSTGGTIYFLANTEIVPGSESVTVQVRDTFIPEKITVERNLKNGVDYEIDYYTGRVRLLSPIAVNAESDAVYRRGVGSGDPIWIVVEYMYAPTQSDFGTYGARWLHFVGRSVGMGTSLLHENTNGVDHIVSGVDFRLKGENDDILRIEVARSTAGGEPWAASLDGGRSFVEIGTGVSSSASAVKGAFNLRFLNGMEWSNYYYDVASEFTGAAFSERGIKRGGTQVSMKKGRREWRADYTRSMPAGGASDAAILNASPDGYHSAMISYKEDFASGSLKAELVRRYDRESNSRMNVKSGITDGFAIRLERKMSERINMYLIEQRTMSSRNSNQATMGINYRMRKDMNFTVEGALGDHEGGGKLGFEKARENGAKYYINAAAGNAEDTGERKITTTAGMSVPVGGDNRFFMEYGMISLDKDEILRKTAGLESKYDAGGGLKLSMSADRSEEQSSLNGSYIANSGEISVDYSISEKMNLRTGTEYRRSSGSIAEEQFLFSTHYSLKTSDDFTISAEQLYSVSSDLRADATETKYTKGILGVAYRPRDDNRLNLFAKAARIRDLRPPSADIALFPDSVSTVLSLEGLYELTPLLQFREKIASKFIKENVDPLPEARAHTILWITGLKYQVAHSWDMDVEYRTKHQPTAFNNRDGVSVETGYIIKDKIRLGVGYNYSSYSDNEFVAEG
ncbi:MAG TPA: hypothetical protein PLQ76_00975, partial [bacterium]|nr:hypothetical protein [bacterium]